MLVTRRLVASVGMGMLAVLLLSGCTPEPPIYARLSGPDILFLICENRTADEILVETAPRGTIEYSKVWGASGESTFVIGDTVMYGLAPAGWTESSSAVPIDIETTAISITVGRSPLSTGGDFLSAVFAGWQLTESGWIGSSGNRVDDPC